MRTTETIVVAASPTLVFPHVARLDAYPAWLPLVFAAEIDDASTDLTHDVVTNDAFAWSVEIRARVGPFARSKRLRMQRTEVVADRLAVFERAELDDRQHARWALRAELEPAGADRSRLTMHLAYDGALWTGGLLERVLEEEIRRGRAGLAGLVGNGAVSDEPTH